MFSVVARRAVGVFRMHAAAMSTVSLNLSAAFCEDGVSFYQVDNNHRHLYRRQGVTLTVAKVFKHEPVTLALANGNAEAVAWCWGTFARNFMPEVCNTGLGVVAMKDNKFVGTAIGRDLASKLPDPLYLLQRHWNDKAYILPKSVDHMRWAGPYLELIRALDQKLVKSYFHDGLEAGDVLNISIAGVVDDFRGTAVLSNMFDVLFRQAKKLGYRMAIINCPHEGIIKAATRLGFKQLDEAVVKYKDFQDSNGMRINTEEREAAVCLKDL